jgi:TM2 domain-containing membrane protein YozV
MNKIIKITDDIIYIGCNDGTIQEVRKVDLNFEPGLGDEVEVYKSETKIFVSKNKIEDKDTSITKEQGVNISINNQSNNTVPIIPAHYETKVIKKTIYIVLAILLGIIGVHKFYEGKPGLGILYLILLSIFMRISASTGVPIFIISFIIVIVDIIRVAYKPADAYGRITL